MTLKDLYEKLDREHTKFCDSDDKKKHTWEIYTPEPNKISYGCKTCTAKGNLEIEVA